MLRSTGLSLLLCLGTVCLGVAVAAGSSPSSLEKLLADSIDGCWGAEGGTETCLRGRLSEYLGTDRDGKSLLTKVGELLSKNEVRVQLPEYLQSAVLVFRPGKGMDFDLHFPKESENDVTPREVRDMMKQNMLMPLLMMIKLKLKALTPIMLAMVSLKATKALILSKIAIILVVGFLIVQICQKLGMAKMSLAPMMPPMEPTPPPPPMYGPPTTASSYEPSSWEPAPGPYARVYDTQSQSHQMAYSSYTPQPTAQPLKYKA